MRRLLLILPVILTAACSEPPQKELNQAQGAIDAARAAGAEQYAKDEYSAAASSLQKAHDAVDQRDYRQALSYALDARERAQDAARAAADGKAAARSKAESSIIALSSEVKRLDAKIKAAEAARVAPRDLHGARAAEQDARNALQEAGTSLAKGDYKAAGDAVAGQTGRIDAAIKALDTAPARVVRRKR
ncbi:MAG: hypothetical protein DMF85_17520 [Acidobacteria bacterium]|nr:MAG: hypothetical protein DMF85_17520 [Acidobacteriota bacterium]PYR76601.1 MAG: hypothetical protein DMF86_11735 [Acidobacteriota bacterium]